MNDALLLIQKALETHQESFAAEPEVHWEGQSYEPQAGRPWLQMQVTGRVRQPAGLTASTPLIWRGQLQLVIKHPADDGLRPAYARAMALADHWKRATTLGTAPLQVVVQEVGLPPAYSSAGWISQPVIVAWYAQEPAT